MEWKNIELDDRERLNEFLLGRFQTGDLTFTNLFIWRIGKNLKYKINDDILYIKGTEDKSEFYYIPLPKHGDFRKIKKQISELLKVNTVIRAVPEGVRILLEDYFSFQEERDRFDYLYKVEKLIELKGRKFHNKKNQVNRFEKIYDFSYEKIDSTNIKEVMDFEDKWCQDRECSIYKGLDKESLGIREIFENYESLYLKGGLLRVQGDIVAFSIGEEITPNTGLIHIEKGDIKYQGVYQEMNKIFLKKEFSHLEYVNREEDLGIDGIKKAKESYNPAMLLKKYIITGEKDLKIEKSVKKC
ncbi:DUF2156 domain-containing protein [Ilyobacter polytropus]|uniref:Uncharacterized conserved protein UCP018688 n=1 Tax=Ilyobacter polytropus (strain ATCC 51220 / DSM 2926 / LMG 16218 / CuHBu1) TaxID=572544 RepID=E3H715_ILYPC|nr:phosphatidylglycerol lysyltransferase domain-containing protein [Ilyobacter polytropus]ADO82534.1 Uncharacterized conserved protein UCP018688 [Ilyobacter polytropus DSM 2926]